MNNYARLPEVKADVAQLGTAPSATLDPIYLRAIEAESRAIDAFCGRAFYTKTATRYFDGNGKSVLFLPAREGESDLISVSSLTVDTGDDGTYETTLVSGTDYRLGPVNSTNKYTIELLTRGTQLAAWTRGQSSVKLIGKFGYSDLTESAGTLGEALDTSETEITMTAGHTVYPGDTMIVGTEEMYVSAAEANTLTVTRGINGTTAASADTATAVSIRRYPAAIEQAIRMRVVANRWDNNQGVPMGEMPRYANDNQFARYMSLLKPYRLMVVA